MEIEFHNGSIYEYYDVPENAYHGLMQAASKGSYFHAHIMDRYSWKRVR